MKRAIQINPADTVAVALQPLAAGEVIDLDGLTIQLTSDIPVGHKFALRNISQGENIIKYGDPIGHAIKNIQQGGLVDHGNVITNLERENQTQPSLTLHPSTLNPHPSPFNPQKSFLGFPRPDGQVGIRNDIWVIPTVGCVNGICRQIVQRAQEQLSIFNNQLSIISFSHPYGCSQLGDDHEHTRLILRDMVLHPNAGGVLVVGLGCENNQPRARSSI